ncbi:MAG TPA: PQQ-dependent dehydrogenase, methanol/ethanol family [Steroidobacteraceae bacterium]|nr:PQQ-dependent dehydrogenase, methanol/ethanol family [Steroidobacteraceae bacterium]
MRAAELLRSRRIAGFTRAFAVFLTMALVGNAHAAGAVSRKSLLTAADDPAEWLTYGRTYDEQRFAPLGQIDTANVKSLGLAWYADLDTARGQEGTPLVIDGTIYISTAWSEVKAYDATTGKLRWEYDPRVPREAGVRLCCDAVNRGLAAWGERLYLGTLDGRLIALDRRNGKVAWSKLTVDPSRPYAITGAPRVIDGRVIIGNSGGEMGVRGYVSAYDASDGRELWRFYTVPGRPGTNTAPHLKRAEDTWKGEWWKLGGGGAVWDSMAYDPALDLLYIGVGNGSPWNDTYRSPGGGDNLYIDSIIALKPATGAYVWHYQTTPGDTWDFDATQHLILADLQIGGQPRKVLMQASKNGFFYVLDRATGQLISARNFVTVNWAKGVDLQSGRPIESPEARIERTGKLYVVVPGAGGAHSWQPMAYDPQTGLAYIPALEAGFPYMPDSQWKPAAIGFNTGMDFAAGAMPADTNIRAAVKAATKGALIAWDPVSQQQRWRVDFKGPWNGGVLATAGGLIFQGNAAREFAAYDAASGAKLWSMGVQTGIIAAPVTYSINGEQYVAVLAGWGGIWALATGVLAEVAGPVRNVSRLLVFKLNGKAELPAEQPVALRPLDPPAPTGTPEQIASGAQQYARFCGACHGDAAYGDGVLPDLRRSALLADGAAWSSVVHEGALRTRGMVGFAPVLSPAQVEAIRDYIIKRANEDKALGDH